MTFRYYEYDPQCPEFTFWNGTDCEGNYTLYCASLTELYRNETGNDKAEVSYNGTACIVNYQTIKTVETIEYVIVNVTGNITEVKNTTIDY